MAVLNPPTGVEIENCTLELTTPGQIRHQSVYTGKRYIYNRGYMWSGVVTFAWSHRNDDDWQIVPAWLDSLLMGGNTTNLAHPALEPTATISGTTPTWVLNQDAARVTFAAGYTGSTADEDFQGEVAVGQHVEAGNRLYRIRKIGVANKRLWLDPPVLPASSTALPTPATTVLCRFMRRGGGRWAPDFRGPWTVDWEEVLP